MKNLTLTLVLLLSCALMLKAQDSPGWMRYPAISPDGKTIAFSYQGDLYRVPSAGGTATVLTLHEAYDFMPVWSHDSQEIAFASDRYGNFDVFIIPAVGGIARRLTFHSSSDYPSDFTADDKALLFSSSRLDIASNQQFPSAVLPELYQVPKNGGRVKQVLSTPANNAHESKDGKLLVFQDSKGYENVFRKHHTSSVTRDIWTYSKADGVYTQLSSFSGEDTDPVLSTDGRSIYYLSEESGSFNVHRMSLENPIQTEQLTDFSMHPVRQLSISDSDVLCYDLHGAIYTQAAGEAPMLVPIDIKVDQRSNPIETIQVKEGMSEMAISPNGKELAFISRGEVFVSSIKEGTTKRVTNTPEQERSISFSPDGRSLLYASERGDSWGIYETHLNRKEEKYFFQSTLLEEKPVHVSDKESFQPSYSPDGNEVAFLEERTALKVINLKSKALREIVPKSSNYSYSDGDQWYEWSPDGKWFLISHLREKQWIDQSGLISSSGTGQLIDLDPSGYGAYAPRWMMDGKLVTWISSRHGMKSHGSWGAELDVYGMFLTQAAWDEYQLSEEEADLLSDEKTEAKEEQEKDKKSKKSKADKEDEKLEPLVIELEGREDRISRLSVHSSDLADALISKDGKTLYYLAKFEKGYDLWQTDIRTKETKILAPLDAEDQGSIALDKEGETLYVISKGHISKVTLADGTVSGVNVQGEMLLDAMAERAYLAEHIWRQVKKKFYRVDLHGVDWDGYKEAYFSKLPYIDNNRDFAELMSELLGELNASHTGAGYRGSSVKNPDQTASLGVFFDENYQGDGLKISEVMAKSPLLMHDGKAKAGMIIEKIDGIAITPDMNQYPLLNRKAGENTLLSFYDPIAKKRWEETVKPIAPQEESQLRYERWVKNCERLVDELSGGKIGYVHVRGMNDESFREVYNNALGKQYDKDALIVDTRFNGGGWLHDDLATFLSGKKYMEFMPRGQDLGPEPAFKWTKPSAVVMSESNYSDAHMFPVTYRALDIGKLIGMPVPGTGTAVWWEPLQNGVVFGIPMVGIIDNQGNYLENQQLEPDIKVANEPAIVVAGRDQQLEVAVKELMKE